MRAQQLSRQPLYAKPPPAWRHPAFAAEFGDSFIGGTALENGARARSDRLGRLVGLIQLPGRERLECVGRAGLEVSC